MATKKPLCDYNGKIKELQSGDTLPSSSPSGSSALFDRYTDVSNWNADDDLDVYCLPANTLQSNGDKLELLYAGSFAANAHIKGLQLFIGANLVFGEEVTSNGQPWQVTVEIVRTSSSAARISSRFTQSDSSVEAFTVYGTASGLDYTAAIALSFHGYSDSANDITLKVGTGKYVAAAPAPTLTTITSLWDYWEADSYSQSSGSTISTSWVGKANSKAATVSGSPTFQTNQLNGLPIVRMPGSAYFTLPSMAAFTEGQIYLVWKITDTSTSSGNTFGSATFDYYPYSGDGKIYSTFGSTARRDAITSGITILNTWHVMSAYSHSADRKLLQNFHSIDSSGTNTVGFPSTPRLGTNGSDYVKGDIAGMYIFTAKLSAADDALVRRYIALKWAITNV